MENEPKYQDLAKFQWEKDMNMIRNFLFPRILEGGGLFCDENNEFLSNH